MISDSEDEHTVLSQPDPEQEKAAKRKAELEAKAEAKYEASLRNRLSKIMSSQFVGRLSKSDIEQKKINNRTLMQQVEIDLRQRDREGLKNPPATYYDELRSQYDLVFDLISFSPLVASVFIIVQLAKHKAMRMGIAVVVCEFICAQIEATALL